jgi:hypothetical protein
MRIIIVCRLDWWPRAGVCKSDRTSVYARRPLQPVQIRFENIWYLMGSLVIPVVLVRVKEVEVTVLLHEC